LNRSMVFAVFSRGDYSRIENVIDMIEAGVFLGKPDPSFGFGLGKIYRIKIYTEYDSIDFIGPKATFNKGERTVIVSNNGTLLSKASIIFKSF
jgi:hypothetical protein